MLLFVWYSVSEARRSKLKSYVGLWEVVRFVNRKILHYLRKKIYIGMLNNHINYTYIHNLHPFDVHP